MPDWADWTGPNDAAGARAAQSGKEKISELPSLTRKSEKLRGDVRPALKVLSPLSSGLMPLNSGAYLERPLPRVFWFNAYEQLGLP